MSNRQSFTRILVWSGALLVLLPLAAHLLISLYNRPMWDDFCFAYDAERLGLMGNISYLYETWTGTYTAAFFIGLFGIFRLWAVNPALMFIGWVVVLVFLLYPVIRLVPETALRKSPRFPLVLSLSALLVVVTANGSHNVYQSVYWTSGAMNYTLPLMLIAVMAGLIFRAVRDSQNRNIALPYLVMIGFLSFLVAGSSALFSAVNIMLWFFVAVGCWLFVPRRWKRASLTASAVALILAVIGFIILASAPGNAVRAGNFGDEMGLVEKVIFSARLAVFFIVTAPYVLIPLLIAIPVGSLFYAQGYTGMRSNRLLLFISFIIEVMFVLVFVGFFTSIFVTQQSPPLRARIVMQHIVVVALALSGAAGGYGLTRFFTRSGRVSQPVVIRSIQAAVVLVALVTGFTLVQMTQHTLNQHERLSVFAAEWDAMERQMITAGPDEDIVLQPFTYDFYLAQGHDPISTLAEENGCMSNYYGVRSVRMADATDGENDLTVGWYGIGL